MSVSEECVTATATGVPVGAAVAVAVPCSFSVVLIAYVVSAVVIIIALIAIRSPVLLASPNTKNTEIARNPSQHSPRVSPYFL